MGYVVPSFKRGSLVAKDGHGRQYRLSWEADQASAERRRALPPGQYTVSNYRISRQDRAGNEWFVSASARTIMRFSVAAGKTVNVTVPDAIQMRCEATSVGAEVRVQMVIQGVHHSGLSIYRDGKRVPVKYQITDANGAALAQGAMQYG